MFFFVITLAAAMMRAGDMVSWLFICHHADAAARYFHTLMLPPCHC